MILHVLPVHYLSYFDNFLVETVQTVCTDNPLKMLNSFSALERDLDPKRSFQILSSGSCNFFLFVLESPSDLG